MSKNRIRSPLLVISIAAVLILVLLYAAVIIHAKETGSNKLLYSLPLLGPGLRAEDIRSDSQKIKELAWAEEDAALPHKNYAVWTADVLDPETLLTSIEWKVLLWKKGDKIEKRDAKVILRYPRESAIGDLPGYTENNEYETSNIMRAINNSLIYGTNEERRELDLPAILIYDLKSEIPLSERNKFLEWLIQNPQNVVFMILAALMVVSFRKQLGLFLNSYSSKSAFIKYKPQKGNIKTPDDIGGLPHVRAEIDRFINVAQYPNIMRVFGGRLLPGVLLSGIPGTGKSLTAQVLGHSAYTLGFTVYMVKTGKLLDFAPASAPNKIQDGFRRARQDKRAMIIFDEAEAFTRARGKTQSGSEEEKSDALVQLLTEIEGVANSSSGSIVVVLISNRPELIDGALLRSGRVGLHLDFPPPKTKGERYEILSIHARQARDNKRFPLDKEKEWLDKIAEETEGFTGADLRRLLEDAGIIAGTPHAKLCAKLGKPDKASSIPADAYLELEHLIAAKDAMILTKFGSSGTMEIT
jgi:hypothetical protein